MRLLALAGLVLFVAASPASAATVSTKIVIEDPSNHGLLQDPVDFVTVTGGAGADELGVALDGSAVVVGNPAGMQAGQGCAAVDARTARCELKGVRRRLALDAGSGADTVRVTAAFASASLTGGDGGDRLEALVGGVVFDGGAGADTITGSDGSVTYAGRTRPVTVVLGRDVAQGEAGEGDRFTGVTSVRGGSGPDRLTATTGGLHLSGGPGADALTAAPAGSDLRGDLGADVLRGGRGPDTLGGGPGSDRVVGGRGDDTLYAGSGLQAVGPYDPVPGDGDGGARDRDVLAGGPGDDALAPGPGRDTVTGGSGADTIGLVGAGVFGGDLVLAGRDVARVRDRSRDIVRCQGRRSVVTADAGDVTLGCRAGLRRVGRPRPGFSEETELPFSIEDGALSTGVGCPDDMPRRCRFAYRVLAGGKVIGRHAGSARPGREAAPDIRLDRAARRRALCRGRVDWRLEVRTRTAAGAPLTLRRALRERFEPDASDC